MSSKVLKISSVSLSFGSSTSFAGGLETYSFLILFFLTFDAKFSFLKSVESISVLIKFPALPGMSFVSTFFGRTKI